MAQMENVHVTSAKKVVQTFGWLQLKSRKHMEGIEDAKLRVDDQEINSASVEDASNDGLGDEDVTQCKLTI